MKKNLSTYLDALRVLAATAVFVSHLSWQEISGGFLWQAQPYGHPAVIVFFVLSGFLIQYSVAAARKNSLADYTVARLGRLYSVVVPALILTYLFDRIGAAHNPAAYIASHEDRPLMRLAAGMLFLNQSWTWNLPLFSNDPFWSLPYEFWYYAIFGAVVYLRGWGRWLAVALFSLIAGPAILLFLPIWLFGVFAYRLGTAMAMGRARAATLFFLTLLLSAILIAAGHRYFKSYNMDYLPPAFSPADFPLGLCLAVNLAAAMHMRLHFAWLERPIKWLAGMTFALYLFHLPLLHLVSVFVPPETRLRGIIIGLATLFAVWALSLGTERKRYLWDGFFRRLISAPTEAKRLERA
jgi:peptidoglycan/LPS O-acetylase OafA/YrhL